MAVQFTHPCFLGDCIIDAKNKKPRRECPKWPTQLQFDEFAILLLALQKRRLFPNILGTSRNVGNGNGEV